MKSLATRIKVGMLIAAGALALGAAWHGTRDTTTPVHAAATEQVNLAAGLCNNVALTWPSGTPLATVAAAVSPANALESIWRQSIQDDRQVFVAFSPLAGAPNDYTTTSSSLEAAFVCVRAAATLNRPDR